MSEADETATPMTPYLPAARRDPRAVLHAAGVGVGAGLLAMLGGATALGGVLVAVPVATAFVLERLRRARAVPRSAASGSREREQVARALTLELVHDRLRSVIEALQEGVLVVDDVGEVVIANPAACRAMAAPEPVGRLLWEALRPELIEHAHGAWQELREHAGGKPQVRIPGIPCGDRVYDLAAVGARSSRSGQDFGTVFLLVDATRAHELQRMKDRFLSNVSHELRTPLTSVCAYAEILHRMPPSHVNEWAEFVRMIHHESQQLSGLVDGMFDYLQLQTGEAEFTDEIFDGVDVVRDAVARSEHKAARRSVTVQVRANGAPPTLRGDPRRFARVVDSLLDNAIKFGPEGGGVCLSVTGREEGFELRVEDGGPGIPVERRLDVFETFQQLRDHMTDKPDGAGIGLATSCAIVARLGGLIWCEDAEGGGACFVVLLPGAAQPWLVGVDTVPVVASAPVEHEG